MRSEPSAPFLRNATGEETQALSSLDGGRLPTHLAVIMDGNRRWARSRSLPSLMGHRAGVRAFRDVVRACSDLGIRVLTAYAFSLENWKRSESEVGLLMRLFEHYSRKDRADMLANGVRFRVIGDVESLPARVREAFAETSRVTAGNSRLILNLAVNYGARGELVRAARALAAEVRDGRLDAEAICEADIERNLHTVGLPDPDLLIRTSGEIRVSNFLLWQMAYTEFWFTERCWPDFRRIDLVHALLDYQTRERRYGGGSAEAPRALDPSLLSLDAEVARLDPGRSERTMLEGASALDEVNR